MSIVSVNVDTEIDNFEGISGIRAHKKVILSVKFSLNMIYIILSKLLFRIGIEFVIYLY